MRILDTVQLEQPVRLLGVRLTNLRHREEQLPLFVEEKMKVFATQAMDEVNNRYGDFTVTFGALLSSPGKKGSFVISPAWRPDGIRCVEVG